LFVALGLVLCAAPLAGRAAAEEPGRRAYRQGVRSTVVVRGSHLMGAGWVADRAQKLVVTCYHVVAPKDGAAKVGDEVDVFFPDYRDGKVVTDPGHYGAANALRGKVRAVDDKHDLAAIQLPSLPGDAEEVKFAADGPEPGDRLHLIGHPEGFEACWVYCTGAVRQVYVRDLPFSERQKVHARLIALQAPTNFGDSGAPAFNDDGELIGMVLTAAAPDAEAHELAFALDVGEIKDFLKDVRTRLER
jgi:S1-C subfamily serine protease